VLLRWLGRACAPIKDSDRWTGGHARTHPKLAQRLPDVYEMENVLALINQVKDFISRT
jgi:hypothetical protein